MKISQILTTAGAGAINSVLPGAGSIVAAAVNAFLPDDKKITPDATGDDVLSAVNGLPPAQRSVVMEKELDVEIEEIRGFTERFKAAAEADQAGSSTRPAIALMMSKVVCFTIIAFVAGAVFSIITDKADLLGTISDSWAFIGVVLAIPSALLRAYFGLRTQEKAARYQLANNEGQDVNTPGLLSAVASMFGKKK